jgi:hypothetical protein
MILSYILVKTRYSQITLGLLDFISVNFWTSCVINEVYLYLVVVFIVLRLVEALRYKSEGRGFDSRWCHWNFFFFFSFRPHYGAGVDSASNRNEYQEYFLG